MGWESPNPPPTRCQGGQKVTEGGQGGQGGSRGPLRAWAGSQGAWPRVFQPVCHADPTVLRPAHGQSPLASLAGVAAFWNVLPPDLPPVATGFRAVGTFPWVLSFI